MDYRLLQLFSALSERLLHLLRQHKARQQEDVQNKGRTNGMHRASVVALSSPITPKTMVLFLGNGGFRVLVRRMLSHWPFSTASSYVDQKNTINHGTNVKSDASQEVPLPLPVITSCGRPLNFLDVSNTAAKISAARQEEVTAAAAVAAPTAKKAASTTNSSALHHGGGSRLS